MKLKCIVIGGLVFFVVSFVIGMLSGIVVHEKILDPLYAASEEFWRPELREDPPNMAALMPAWIFNSLVLSFVIAALYCSCSSGGGSGAKRGAKFGVGLAIFLCAVFLSWSGLFDLPGKMFLIWGLEAIAIYAVSGAAMGWAVGKWCSDG